MFTEESIDAMLRVFVIGLAILLVTGASFAQGKQFLTTKEALELAFPKCEVERHKHVLDDAQQQQIEELCGDEPPRAMVYAYRATKDGELVGTAWFDRHRVRSKQELLMIVVDPEGKVARVEIIAFEEPVDYLPRDGWYEQLIGKPLCDDLSTKRAIRPVAGATLTVNATLAAVRRVLAVHRVLFKKERPPVDEKVETEKGEPAEKADESKQAEKVDARKVPGKALPDGKVARHAAPAAARS